MSCTPSAPLKLHVGGMLIPGEHIYIERPTDQLLHDLLRQGEYCNILTSRQMGKSSLMMQTAAKLSAEGYHTATPDASLLGAMLDSEQWYRGLLAEIADELGLNVSVDEWWRNCPDATPNQRLLRFFREEVAAKLSGDKSIIIFVDEIDSTLKLPYTDDFFTAIRAMYNQRGKTPEYRRIAFCLVGVAAPDELIKDRRTTPYNIGKTLELLDFDLTRDDLKSLYKLSSGDKAQDEAIVREVLRHTGGQPYLTLRLCEALAAKGDVSPADATHLVNADFASLDAVKNDLHFQQMLRFLNERVDDKLLALKLYRQILSGEPVKDQLTPAHIALKLAGIVKRYPDGRLVVRNEIYRRLFTNEWAVKTAESDTRTQVEMKGWQTAARFNEQVLGKMPDDYQVAFSHYQSLFNNPVYDKHKAQELWAQYFEYRALRAQDSKRLDEVLLWRVLALKEQPSVERKQALGEIIGTNHARLLTTLRHTDEINVVAFNPDGSTLATGSRDNTVCLWDTATWQPFTQPLHHEKGVWTLAFSPDGRILATGSDDKTVRLWDAVTGQLLAQPLRHVTSVRTLAFSPDGDTLATGGANGTARLWDAATGLSLFQLFRHEDVVWTLAFSPDRHTLATGSGDYTVRLWDVATGQLCVKPLDHEDWVWTLAFSPDGRTLATGSRDKTARLWDATTGQPLAQPFHHKDRVLTLAFSPNGHILATGSADKTARLWDMQIKQSQAQPLLQDDPVELLRDWERRLGLKINEAGEIVPL
jgi:WD40 repeat protein